MSRWIALGFVVVVTAACSNGQPAPQPPRPIEQSYTAADLASPDQAVRDGAAAQVRASWQPPPRSTWEPLLASIVVGETKDAVHARLPPTAKQGPGGGSGQTHTEQMWLDDVWILECYYNNAPETVNGCELVDAMQWVWVDPPADFTGVWIAYWANGQKSHEWAYEAGEPRGRQLSYHSNGALAVESTVGPDGPIGDEVGYHPSGAVAYRGQYADGRPTGTWTFYKEDGSVESTQDRSTSP